MRIWNGSSWARWDGTLTTSAVHIGLVDQGAAGATPWPVSLAAETTKVIGTVNQGTSPWVVSGSGVFHVDDNSASLTVDAADTSFGATVTPKAASTWDVSDRDGRLVGVVSGGGNVFHVDDNAGSLTVDNAGTFAVQASLAAETTKVIGTVNQGTSPWVTSRNWTLSSGTDSVSAVQATAASLNATVVGTGTFATQATVAQLPTTLGYAAKGSALAVVVANDQDDLGFTLQRAVVQRLDLLLSQIVTNYSPSDNLY